MEGLLPSHLFQTVVEEDWIFDMLALCLPHVCAVPGVAQPRPEGVESAELVVGAVHFTKRQVFKWVLTGTGPPMDEGRDLGTEQRAAGTGLHCAALARRWAS